LLLPVFAEDNAEDNGFARAFSNGLATECHTGGGGGALPGTIKSKADILFSGLKEL
jgi:hypothetical protein